ncbi:uncharacterized protein BDZ83DRAFT_650214 [Colletotrichum acutatum]|uniref:Uncharacterized protein n=1 Tax=Glomerella acutata TaxID=27357 RepID=A0AAD8URU1_GLOAC|nr:uncharacterized protein BDZ83DRAFT_650214 [Colletotrichum acutatum]KAK1726724.1 hypothetical protein BDZ83DRAFT_650214 [Colletotrichum acutatum]
MALDMLLPYFGVSAKNVTSRVKTREEVISRLGPASVETSIATLAPEQGHPLPRVPSFACFFTTVKPDLGPSDMSCRGAIQHWSMNPPHRPEWRPYALALLYLAQPSLDESFHLGLFSPISRLHPLFSPPKKTRTRSSNQRLARTLMEHTRSPRNHNRAIAMLSAVENSNKVILEPRIGHSPQCPDDVRWLVREGHRIGLPAQVTASLP